jgi:hypothetical protein
MSNDENDEQECPLCMETLDFTDKQFFPCACSYQICVLCFHHIVNNANGKCPACRTPYEPQNFIGTPPDADQIAKVTKDKKTMEKQAKQQASNSRKHLSNVRVIQRNLVYVIGLPLNCAKEETLRRYEYFGQYGRIVKVVINKNNLYNANSPQGPTCSAYITFANKGDAHICIAAVDGVTLDNRILRASFGTTKYCSYFLRNIACTNPDCMYLHELGEDADSFTKEEMINSKQHFSDQAHPSHVFSNGSGGRQRTILPPPPSRRVVPPAQAQTGSASAKPTQPSTQQGKSVWQGASSSAAKTQLSPSDSWEDQASSPLDQSTQQQQQQQQQQQLNLGHMSSWDGGSVSMQQKVDPRAPPGFFNQPGMPSPAGPPPGFDGLDPSTTQQKMQQPAAAQRSDWAPFGYQQQQQPMQVYPTVNQFGQMMARMSYMPFDGHTNMSLMGAGSHSAPMHIPSGFATGAHSVSSMDQGIDDLDFDPISESIRGLEQQLSLNDDDAQLPPGMFDGMLAGSSPGSVTQNYDPGGQRGHQRGIENSHLGTQSQQPDWQENLRKMLPGVNVSFAGNGAEREEEKHITQKPAIGNPGANTSQRNPSVAGMQGRVELIGSVANAPSGMNQSAGHSSNSWAPNSGGFHDPAIMAFNPLRRGSEDDEDQDAMGTSLPPGFAPPPGFEPNGFFTDVARIGTSQQA